VDDPESITEPESDPPQQVIAPPRVDDPESITEPESDVPQQVIAPPHVDDPESITEPESDPPGPPQQVIASPHVDDPESVTEPETEPESIIAAPKRKSFFDTPSPPASDSLYWKYVSREEDAKWYDRSHTDNSFLTVRQIKQELKDLC
jgi:hypothetical protein